MKHHRTTARAATAAVIAIAASTLIAGPADSTPATGFTAAQQWKGVYGPLDVNADKTDAWDVKIRSKDTSDVYVTRNAIDIDGQSGWHTHPGPSLITVTLGEVTVYESSLCTPVRYHMGEGFVDSGGGHVHLIRNESGAAAETVAVQFVPQGATRRIDAPQPNNCNF
jgi:quercetin dioxygenase-like cupin family protein